LRIEQDILQIKLRASEAVLADAQEMAHVGNWDIDLVAKSYLYSAEAYRTFGVDSATFQPSFNSIQARIHPDDQRAVGEDIAETVSAVSETKGSGACRKSKQGYIQRYICRADTLFKRL
jgi:hypothetical protein